MSALLLPCETPEIRTFLPYFFRHKIQGFQEYIRNERAYELAFEGNRRQDLIRWGIYYETIVNTYIKLIGWYPEANYVAYQYTQKNKHELLPIPARDMSLMENFKQNQGWGD